MRPPTESSRPWWVLVGTCTGPFLVMLDAAVVALALPTIQQDLHAGADTLQWVMNSYLLVTCVLVITVGRLGDMFGRRLLFVSALAVFALGSLLAALAGDGTVLVLARCVQGVGGAALLSLSLALVSHAFPVEKQGHALGIWAASSAIALAIGPLVGGVLIEADWRWIFWINLPVCAVGIAITLWAARESRDETAAPTLDYPGMVALSLGLFAVVLALIEANTWGWGSPATLVVLAVGLLVLWGFWLIEHRVPNPIVDFALFRNGPYLGASGAAFALIGSYLSLIFFQPQFLQDVLGHSAIAAGLLILPITAPLVVISPFSGRLIERFGVRELITLGMFCGAAGLALLTLIDASSSYAELLPGYLLFGIGLGLVYAPMATAAMLAMPRAKAGIAAGVLVMCRLTAGAVVLAVTGAVFQEIQTRSLDARPGNVTGAFADAVAGSTWVLVGLMAAGAVLAFVLLRRSPAAAPGTASSPDSERIGVR